MSAACRRRKQQEELWQDEADDGEHHAWAVVVLRDGREIIGQQQSCWARLATAILPGGTLAVLPRLLSTTYTLHTTHHHTSSLPHGHPRHRPWVSDPGDLAATGSFVPAPSPPPDTTVGGQQHARPSEVRRALVALQASRSRNCTSISRPSHWSEGVNAATPANRLCQDQRAASGPRGSSGPQPLTIHRARAPAPAVTSISSVGRNTQHPAGSPRPMDVQRHGASKTAADSLRSRSTAASPTSVAVDAHVLTTRVAKTSRLATCRNLKRPLISFGN